jgi:hypothetical protein
MKLDTSRREMTGLCKELAPGGPYFTVSYPQTGSTLPKVETLVYLGKTQIEFEKGKPETRFMFQDAWSYQNDGNWSELPKEQQRELEADASVSLWPEEMLPLIADIDGLLVLLNNFRERLQRGWGVGRVLPQERP